MDNQVCDELLQVVWYHSTESLEMGATASIRLHLGNFKLLDMESILASSRLFGIEGYDAGSIADSTT